MNKFEGYKLNIQSFLDKNKYNNTLNNLNTLMIILFLTDFYKKCKNTNLSYHGYYAMIGLLEIYADIENNIINETSIDNHKLSKILIIQVCKNIHYLNEKINYKNEYKKKISKNLPEMLLLLNVYLDNIKNGDKTYINAINNLKHFYVILWTLSNFMAYGEINKTYDKISEYYACLFYAGICVKKNDTVCELLNNYFENKEKLMSFLMTNHLYDENIKIFFDKMDEYVKV